MSVNGPNLTHRPSAFVSAFRGIAAAPAPWSARQFMTHHVSWLLKSGAVQHGQRAAILDYRPITWKACVRFIL